MKTKILSIFSGVVALILTACSSDIATEPEAPSGKSDSFLRLDIQKQDLTRGDLISSFKEGDVVKILVREAYNEGMEPIVTQATYHNGEWNMADEIILSGNNAMLSGDRFIVWAVYPNFYLESDRGWQNLMVFNNLYDGNSNGVINQDVLTGFTYVTPGKDTTAKITCGHLKPRLTFALKNNAARQVKISKITVENSGKYNFLAQALAINNTLSPIGEYGYQKVIADIDSCSFACNVDIPAGEISNLDFLLLPTDIQNYEMMKDIDENGGEKSVLNFTLEVKVPTTGKTSSTKFTIDATAWSSGYQYTYPVSLFNRPKHDPIPDTDEYVDLGLSVLWAKCNVGASTPEEIGKFFFWGNTKGFDIGEHYYASDAAYVYGKSITELLEAKIIEPDPISNDIFQFGYPYRLTPSYDAATQNMGSPWRMPNETEIKELIDNTTMEWHQDGDKWIFKLTSTVPGFEDRFITLAAPGGYFSGGEGIFTFSGNISNVPGEWWGSTPYSNLDDLSVTLSIWWEDPINLHEKAKKFALWDRRRSGLNVRGVRPFEID